MVLPEEAGIGAVPPVGASLPSVAKRSAPAISPITFRGGQRAAAARGEQLRRVVIDQRGELCLQLANPGGARGDLTHKLRDSHARDSHGRLLRAGEPAGDLPEPLVDVQRSGWDFELGPHVVQTPAELLLIGGAGGD